MTDLDAVIERHRKSGIAIDSNLLLLLVVGLVDQKLATRFKRTCIFAQEDFELLKKLLARFEKRFVTPHVLTEVSNFIGQVADPQRQLCRVQLAQFVKPSDEHHTPAKDLLEMTEYYTFGLTDASITDLALRQLLVVTVDAPLAHYLSNKGLPAVNFNHVRAAAWRN
jgi:hypothetical protein